MACLLDRWEPFYKNVVIYFHTNIRNTPIVTYIFPTPTTYDLGDITVGTLTVTTLIVDSETPCPPTDAGTFGQVSVCDNYLYIYDGVEWKRSELSVYY